MVIDQLFICYSFFIKHNIHDNSGVIVLKLVVRSDPVSYNLDLQQILQGEVEKIILSVIILYKKVSYDNIGCGVSSSN